jgi:hypothetical protein
MKRLAPLALWAIPTFNNWRDLMSYHRRLAVALIFLTTGAVSAQPAPQRARFMGTVRSLTAHDLILTTAKGDVDLAITPRTRVLLRQPGAVNDIKPGAYLGTTNQDGTDVGTGKALEIHLMANGPNINYQMNKSGLTMTNGHVKSVTATATGEEMDVDYGQATARHVVVIRSTNITRMIDVSAGSLTPGTNVNAMTNAGTDGKLTATLILITSAAKPSP